MGICSLCFFIKRVFEMNTLFQFGVRFLGHVVM